MYNVRLTILGEYCVPGQSFGGVMCTTTMFGGVMRDKNIFCGESFEPEQYSGE